MKNANDELVSRQGRTKLYKCRPGWNDHARDLHTAARECFIMWIDAGRPKHGPVFDLMKTSRARFKYAMRFLKSMNANLEKIHWQKNCRKVGQMTFGKKYAR